MEPQLVLLVLAAALLHAVWNGLVKHSDSPLFTLAGVHLLGALAGIALASAVPAPHPDSWPFLAASVAIHTAYYALLAQAYRFGDLSYVYPLARGAAPMLVALGGSIFAAEWLPPVAIAGMVLASFGIASIGFSRNSLRSTSRPALGFALATSLAIAAYTVTDGIGVRNADSAFGYIAWLIVLEAVPIGLYAGVYRRREFGVYLRKRWLVCAAGGIGLGRSLRRGNLRHEHQPDGASVGVARNQCHLRGIDWHLCVARSIWTAANSLRGTGYHRCHAAAALISYQGTTELITTATGSPAATETTPLRP